MAVISFVGSSVPVGLEEFDEFLNRSDGDRVNESDGFLEVASSNGAVLDFVQEFDLLGDIIDTDSLVNCRDVMRFRVGLLVGIPEGNVFEVLMDICEEVVNSFILLSDAFEVLEDCVDVMSDGFGVLEALSGTLDDIATPVKDFEFAPYDATDIVKKVVDFVYVEIDALEVWFNFVCVVVDAVDTASLDGVATVKKICNYGLIRRGIPSYIKMTLKT